MMTFTCTLTCPRCKAALRFENERPEWKTYDYRVEQADECEKSAKFVAENADKPIPDVGEDWPAYADAGHPEFIKADTVYGPISLSKSFIAKYGRLVLDIPKPYRYVDCPVCDAQVKEPS